MPAQETQAIAEKLNASVLFWRRTNVNGLERLELWAEPNRIVAASTVICLEYGGFRLEHRWKLTPDWRVLSAEIERWSEHGHARVRLERVGNGWEVDGAARPDLNGVDEPDLSITPFCNTFPIRKVPQKPGQSLTLDTAFIDSASLTVTRSRQRYERQGPGRFRYIDLGLFSGFEANLTTDEDGLIQCYEGLFERVTPSV